MPINIYVIGPTPAIVQVFQKVAEESDGAIRLCGSRADFSNMTSAEVISHLRSLSLDFICTDPFNYSNGYPEFDTRLIREISQNLKGVKILVYAPLYDRKTPDRLIKKGGHLFLAYHEVTPDRVRAVLEDQVSRPYLTFTNLRLIPEYYQIELVGKLEDKADKITNIVAMRSSSRMRLLYFLALERCHGRSNWLKFIPSPSLDIKATYQCEQTHVWKQLDDALPRAPRTRAGTQDKILVESEILSRIAEFIDKPMQTGAKLKEVVPNDLSQTSGEINSFVKSVFRDYKCAPLIIGPPRGSGKNNLSPDESRYKINDQIAGPNIKLF